MTFVEFYEKVTEFENKPLSISDYCMNGDLLEVKLYTILLPHILPTQHGAFSATRYGYLEIVKFLAFLEPPILLNEEAANWAEENEHVEVLDFLASLTPPIYPN